MSDNFYITGGTLPPAAESYVVRRADAELLDGLRAGEFCYVLDTRQMGKSSLMVRTAQRLREDGRRVAVLDLTALGQNLTVEQWYSGLLSRTATQTGRMAELMAFWKEHKDLGPMQRFLEALREVLLTPPPGVDSVADLVLFVDEIDAVRILPFSADEFFAGIRECYNRRPQDPAFERLTFCLLGVAAPTDLVRDTRISPFNIGRRIELRDFTLDEAEPLTKGLAGKDSRARRLIQRILSWTNGHPYMTQRLCRSVAERLTADSKPLGPRYDSALVDNRCRDLFLTHAAQETDDNLAFVRNRLLHSEADVGTLLDFYLTIRQGKRVRDDPANPLCSLLLLSGIVARSGDRLIVRNRIYAEVFDRAWVLSSLPGEEVRRQRQAYLRGALRTAAAGGAILLLVAALAGVAINRADVARLATARAVAQSKLAAHEETLARARLSRAYVEDSTRLVDAGDAGAALAPLVEAMTLDHNDPTRMVQHRMRFAAALALAPRIQYLWQPGGPLRWASYSPDKKRVAAAGQDGRAHVWDVATGRELPLTMAHDGAITDAVFSPDSSRLMTCGEDARARVWDLNARRLLWTLGPLAPIQELNLAQTDGRTQTTRAAWSQDGRRIAVVWGSAMNIWNIQKNGKPILATPRPQLPGARLSGIVFSPNGERATIIATNFIGLQISIPGRHTITALGSKALGGCYVGFRAAYSRDGQRLLVAGMFGQNGEKAGACVFSSQAPSRLATTQLTSLMRHGQFASDAAWSPDERRIATAGADGVARVWNAATGLPVTPPLTHTRSVTHVSFSPDGRRILTACDDGSAHVWDAATGAAVCAPLRHAGPLVAAQFGADSSHVFTAGHDGTARLWALPPSTPQPDLHFTSVQSHIVVASGARLVVANKKISMYDLASANLISSRATTQNQCYKPPPRSERFVTAYGPHAGLYGSQDFQVWDQKLGTPISPILHGVQAFLSPDGKMLMLREADGARRSLRILDPATGRALLPPFPDQPSRNDITSPFTPDGRGVLIREGSQSVRLMDTRTGLPLGASMQQQNRVVNWVFSPDGRYLVLMLDNAETQIRNLPSGTPASGVIHRNRADYAASVQFSPDGRYAITVCETYSYFWPLTGDNTLHPRMLKPAGTHSLVFSPNGKTFVAPGWKNWLWNTERLTPIPLSIDYATPPESAVFSPDNARVLTVLADGTANVWDARSGRPVTAPLHQNGIVAAEFSPDGTMAATLGGDGMCRIWDANTGEAISPLFSAQNPLFSSDGIEFTGNRLLVSTKDQLDVWNMPSISEPLDRLMARAQLLSGSRIDPEIGPIPVSPTTLSADWALVGSTH
ncbi:MAG: AAA-like domain-containing protein [Capsulimonas sp.]